MKDNLIIALAIICLTILLTTAFRAGIRSETVTRQGEYNFKQALVNKCGGK